MAEKRKFQGICFLHATTVTARDLPHTSSSRLHPVYKIAPGVEILVRGFSNTACGSTLGGSWGIIAALIVCTF